MSKPSPKVDAFVKRATAWRAEIEKLRAILLGCGLDEDLKWGKPCYSHDGRNVAIVQPFKPHCALMFFEGVSLDDPHGLLRSQGPNTRSAKRLEFTSEREIVKTVVRSFVEQAKAAAGSGRKPAAAPSREPDLPAELVAALKDDPRLAKAFRALTPGRQRGYALHVAGAKQPATRTARIETCRPRILAGKGMHDR